MRFLESPTKYLFFTGKGGVGKTSLACASAVSLADRGRRVLLVSTDPASNLDDVLGLSLSMEPTEVRGAPGLWAMNIDPEAAAHAYRERVVGPYRSLLPVEAVRHVEEQLSGACTVEIAAFDEFTALVGGQRLASRFDHVVFDTAPTGHTLRLLSLPAAWTDFIRTNQHGGSCIGPLSGLKSQQERYQETVRTLGNPKETTLILVARPDPGSLREAERTSAELADLGLANQHLIVNGVFRASRRGDSLAQAWQDRGRAALESLPERLRSLPRSEVILRGIELLGIESIRSLASSPWEVGRVADSLPAVSRPPSRSLRDLVDAFASGDHGLIMVMGKGGVGKTTLASAIAVELAARGRAVHLTTTDPAADLSSALEAEVEGLRISRIDPAVETAAYRERVFAETGNTVGDEGRALLEEDLRSPCTEEVAVFQAFSRVVAAARRGFVVLDTAPTGHTLLLLDATGSYHRETLRRSGGIAGQLTTPLMRLRDPAYTKVLIVTLAETTPILEAKRLQADLRRAGIEPYAWIVNATIAYAETSDPVLGRRAAAERRLVTALAGEVPSCVVVVPWAREIPVGAERLRELANPA